MNKQTECFNKRTEGNLKNSTMPKRRKETENGVKIFNRNFDGNKRMKNTNKDSLIKKKKK